MKATISHGHRRLVCWSIIFYAMGPSRNIAVTWKSLLNDVAVVYMYLRHNRCKPLRKNVFTITEIINPCLMGGGFNG